MAHHKRRRPKHQRAGCLMCKPAKDERRKKMARPSVQRALQDVAFPTGYGYDDAYR